MTEDDFIIWLIDFTYSSKNSVIVHKTFLVVIYYNPKINYIFKSILNSQ